MAVVLLHKELSGDTLGLDPTAVTELYGCRIRSRCPQHGHVSMSNNGIKCTNNTCKNKPVPLISHLFVRQGIYSKFRVLRAMRRF
jgi:hypothetical protein